MGKKTMSLALAFTMLLAGDVCLAQDNILMPDLGQITKGEGWKVFNRKVQLLETDGGRAIFFNAQPDDGIAWLEGVEFTNGVIEVDIKGKDVQGRSFVGVAFRGVDEHTYDAVYFRPFNFHAEDPARKGHGVQYVSYPVSTWYKLRSEQPEQYENSVNNVADPNAFFHAKIIVARPAVRVYVNGSEEPCLVVNELSERTGGWVGLWTGNNSDGTFANLKINPQDD